MTTDFLLTRSLNGKVWYEAFNVKPEDELRNTRVCPTSTILSGRIASILAMAVKNQRA